MTAAGAAPDPPLRLVDEHLRCDPDLRSADRWVGCADVLCGSRPLPAGCAVPRAGHLLAAFPGCLVSAVPVTGDGGWVLAVRGGPTLIARALAGCARADHGAGAAPDHGAWLASLLHAWLATGRRARRLTHAETRLRCGDPRCDGWRYRLAELPALSGPPLPGAAPGDAPAARHGPVGRTG